MTPRDDEALSPALTQQIQREWNAALRAILAGDANDPKRLQGQMLVMQTLTEAIARQARAEGQRERGWQPIETAPKDGRPVIGYDLSRESECLDGIEFMRWLNGGWLDPETHSCRPTHWMPLPAPPKAAKESER